MTEQNEQSKPQAAAAKPAPAARMRSASVPWGTYSTMRVPSFFCKAVCLLVPVWLTMAFFT